MHRTLRSLRPFLLVFAACLLLSSTAQAKAPYELRFLKARMMSAIGEQEVLVLIQVIGAAKDLPPLPENEIRYRFGEGAELLTSLDADGDGRYLIYGKDLREKAPLIYQYVADKLDTSREHYSVLAIYVKTPPEEDFERMSLTCTLRPRSNPKLRVMKQFSFAIEP